MDTRLITMGETSKVYGDTIAMNNSTGGWENAVDENRVSTSGSPNHYKKIQAGNIGMDYNINHEVETDKRSMHKNRNDVGFRNEIKFHQEKVVHKTARGVKVLVIIISIYVVTKFPMFLCHLVQYNYFKDQTILKFGVTLEFYNSAIILSQLNSVLFPVVYIFGNREIFSRLKEAALKMKTLLI